MIVSYAILGDFVNGLRHGRGTMRFPDGSVYSGAFSSLSCLKQLMHCDRRMEGRQI